MASVNTVPQKRSLVIHTDFLVVGGILLSILTFGPALSELVQRWDRQQEYSHGFLIPVVTIWLLWTRRDALRANVGQPIWFGLILIVVASTLNVTGELSGIFIFSRIGFVVALLGIVLSVGGYSLLRVVFIPVAFLLFAIPLPGFVDAELTLRLQLISSELGAFFIRLLGIPVYLDGNIIDMGSYKLQVVEACSGLRYLYPFISLSVLAAYLFHVPLWQRLLVIVSSIPIAVGMNGFRIGLVGALVDRWGAQMADGALHLFEGWVIFLACAGILTMEMYFLASVDGKALADVFYPPQPRVDIRSKTDTKSTGKGPLISSLLFLCVAGVAATSISARSEVAQPRPRFVEFPTRIEEWHGNSSLLDPGTEKDLALDDYMLSDYRRHDGDVVNLYVAYFASQREGASLHSPRNCIPGSGWQIAESRQINYGGGDEGRPLNRVLIKKGAAKQLVYYWFDEQGRNFANEYWARFYRLADFITENRSDAALVRLMTEIKPSESEADADRRLQTFMQVALTPLKVFLPSNSAMALNLAITKSSDPRL